MYGDKEQQAKQKKKVTIVGLGGSGCMAVHHIAEKTDEYNLMYIDNNDNLLSHSTVETLKLATKECRDIDFLLKLAKKNQKLIIIAGFGGGFGTFVAPIMIAASKMLNINASLILTLPASFEGKKRTEHANKGLELLNGFKNSVIIEFDKLIDSFDKNTSLKDCFSVMNEVLYLKVKEILA